MADSPDRLSDRSGQGRSEHPDDDARVAVLRSGADAYFFGEFDVAIRVMSRAAAEWPGDAVAALILAYASFRAKDWRQSIQAAERLQAIVPSRADAIAIAAVAKTRLGAWDDAVLTYQTLLATEKTRSTGMAALSGVLGRVTRLGDAARRYRLQLDSDRQRLAGEAGLTRALAETGDWAEVAGRTSATLADRPDHVPSLVLAIKAAIGLDRLDESLALWTALARNDPQEVVRRIRILERQGRIEWAVQALRGLVAGRGRAYDVMMEQSRLAGELSIRATEARRAGDAATAARVEQAMRAIPPLHPDQSPAHDEGASPVPDDRLLVDDPLLAPILGDELRARIHAMLDHPSHETERRARRGGEPTSPAAPARQAWEGELEIVEGILARGAFDEAAEAAATLIKRYPNRTRVRQMTKRIARARLLAARDAAKEGRHNAVISLLANAEVLPDDRLEVHAALARAYLSEGQYGLSLERWRLVVEFQPDNAKAWIYLARCCRSLGLLAEGRAAAARKLALEPGDAKTQALLAEFDRKLAAS